MKSRDLYQGALSPGWARLASNLRASRRENGGSSAKTRKMVGNRGAEPQCFRRRRALAPSGRGRYCRVPGGPGVLSLPLYGDETGVGKPLRNPPCGPWKLCGTSAWRWPVRKRPRLRTGPYPSSFPSSLRSRFRNSAHGKTTARMKPTRENAEDDINRDHKRVTKIPPSPNTRTTPPIIAATNATFLLSKSSLCSKSSAITTPT